MAGSQTIIAHSDLGGHWPDGVEGCTVVLAGNTRSLPRMPLGERTEDVAEAKRGCALTSSRLSLL